MNQIVPKIQNLAIQSFTTVFSNLHDGAALAPLDPDDILTKLDHEAVASLIGVIGPSIRLTVIICCGFTVLRNSYPLKRKDTADEKALKDWGGEISNLVAGHFKQSLKEIGIDCEIRPPSLFEYSDSFIKEYEEKAPTLLRWFDCGGETVGVQITADLEDDFKPGNPPDAKSIKKIAPGSLIDFDE
jgi:CheY-specific phosphatase CheX